MTQQETAEQAAERKYTQGVYIINGIDICEASRECFVDGAKWQQERILNFINNEDNHTEGELGNSCIDVQTLVNFIKNAI